MLCWSGNRLPPEADEEAEVPCTDAAPGSVSSLPPIPDCSTSCRHIQGVCHYPAYTARVAVSSCVHHLLQLP